jgi:hypothetical protein
MAGNNALLEICGLPNRNGLLGSLAGDGSLSGYSSTLRRRVAVSEIPVQFARRADDDFLTANFLNIYSRLRNRTSRF